MIKNTIKTTIKKRNIPKNKLELKKEEREEKKSPFQAGLHSSYTFYQVALANYAAVYAKKIQKRKKC